MWCLALESTFNFLITTHNGFPHDLPHLLRLVIATPIRRPWLTLDIRPSQHLGFERPRSCPFPFTHINLASQCCAISRVGYCRYFHDTGFTYCRLLVTTHILPWLKIVSVYATTIDIVLGSWVAKSRDTVRTWEWPQGATVGVDRSWRYLFIKCFNPNKM